MKVQCIQAEKWCKDIDDEQTMETLLLMIHGLGDGVQRCSCFLAAPTSSQNHNLENRSPTIQRLSSSASLTLLNIEIGILSLIRGLYKAPPSLYRPLAVKCNAFHTATPPTLVGHTHHQHL